MPNIRVVREEDYKFVVAFERALMRHAYLTNFGDLKRVNGKDPPEVEEAGKELQRARSALATRIRDLYYANKS